MTTSLARLPATVRDQTEAASAIRLKQPSAIAEIRSWTSMSIWVFAAALLLKSAMPWLASASAQMQGKTLVEVCTVYGVSLVAQPGGDAGVPHSGQASHHGGEHCALTALTAFAPIEPLAFAPVPVLLHAAEAPRAHPSSQAPDACARWVARLKHGPPTLA